MDTGIYIWDNDLILLSTRDLSKDYDACALLRNVVVHNPVCVGFSLPNQEGIKKISTFYRQAAYALERGMNKQKQKAFQYFENYAMEYLLTAKADVKDKVMAVMPGCIPACGKRNKKEVKCLGHFCVSWIMNDL